MSTPTLETRPDKRNTPRKKTARARIGLICDFVEEGWPSMDLVAGMLFERLDREQSAALEVSRIQPPLRRRFERIPGLGSLGVCRQADSTHARPAIQHAERYAQSDAGKREIPLGDRGEIVRP